MKKVYTKPALYAESFELAEHITGSCATDDLSHATYRDLSQCGLKISGQNAIAFQSNSICHDWYNTDLEEWVDVYCYNSFMEESKMFAS